MNIFLEAFVDTNFGDNLFLDITASRYADHEFYMCVKPEYEESYILLERSLANLHLVRKTDRNFWKQMDGMFVIGGDMFADRADLSQLIYQTGQIKKTGGFVAFLGNSLFPDYSPQTCADLKVMFSNADVVVMREQNSYEQLKKLAPHVPACSLADMVFSADISEYKETAVKKGLMGISVRKKASGGDEESYQRYCRGLCVLTETYLRASKDNEIVFLSFSCGVFDDRKVVENILAGCPVWCHDRISHKAFDGNIRDFTGAVAQCESLICTRFHALVFALLFEKQFAPIIYEEKMERLLNEVGYTGIRQHYQENIDADGILKNLTYTSYSAEKMAEYLEKASHFFDAADRLMQMSPSGNQEQIQIEPQRKKTYPWNGRKEYAVYWLKPRVWGRRLYRFLKKCMKRRTSS